MDKIPVTIPYFTESEEIAAINVLRTGWVAQGPRVSEFEEAVAEHENVKFGVATSSCTTALHLAMISMGMGASMDVLAPAFTFVATINSIVATGATPILIDVCQDTFNIDVDMLINVIKDNYVRDKEVYRNKKTGNLLWGIVPVHQFGLCCNILEINKIAKEYGFKVVEDAACALGAKINETHIGGFGNPACVSFHPRKSITTGEGGMILTDNGKLARFMKELRSHGSSVSADTRHAGKGFLLPEFKEAGYNYRMTDIQGAIGIEQVKKLDYILDEKRKRARIYDQLISNFQTCRAACPPYVVPALRHKQCLNPASL